MDVCAVFHRGKRNGIQREGDFAGVGGGRVVLEFNAGNGRNKTLTVFPLKRSSPVFYTNLVYIVAIPGQLPVPTHDRHGRLDPLQH